MQIVNEIKMNVMKWNEMNVMKKIIENEIELVRYFIDIDNYWKADISLFENIA